MERSSEDEDRDQSTGGPFTIKASLVIEPLVTIPVSLLSLGVTPDVSQILGKPLQGLPGDLIGQRYDLRIISVAQLAPDPVNVDLSEITRDPKGAELVKVRPGRGGVEGGGHGILLLLGKTSTSGRVTVINRPAGRSRSSVLQFNQQGNPMTYTESFERFIELETSIDDKINSLLADLRETIQELEAEQALDDLLMMEDEEM